MREGADTNLLISYDQVKTVIDDPCIKGVAVTGSVETGKAIAIWGKMNNTEQCCVAAKRFIVVDEVAKEFLEQFRSALSVHHPGGKSSPPLAL